MRDILPDLESWLTAGDSVVLATVVRTWGSSPRGIGAKMGMTAAGKIAGSVSGGCVEGAVYDTGVDVLKTGKPQLLHFGVADETAWTVGLACGGQVDVFVQPLNESNFNLQRKELQAGKPYLNATVIRGPEDILGKVLFIAQDTAVPSGLPVDLEQSMLNQAQKVASQGASQVVTLETSEGPIDVFLEVVQPQLQLVVVGGTHTTIALTRLANVLGYRTVVVDPRRAFASNERFPHVDELIQAWPEEAFEQIQLTEGTAVAMLTHDPKIDDPAILTALKSPVFYIGVLGSPTTQEKLRNRLLEAGVSLEQMERLHGPIGLKLGSSTPEEIALSVMAEIVAVKHRVVA